MAVSELQLETWSHQGSVVQSEATYQTVKGTLESPQSPYASKDFDVFLQGSYGNETNIYSESDVDIVICLKSSFFYDDSWLNDTQKKALTDNFSGSDVSYGFDKFKQDVLSWLIKVYGSDVSVGSKAIRVKANGARRDTDVLVCIENRKYRYFYSSSNNDYYSGIKFKKSTYSWIVNFPIQHRENCTHKNGVTSYRFKKNVRVFKNMRNAMAKDGFLEKKRAPSYYLEGMLHNVPNDRFSSSYSRTFESALYWLENYAEKEEMLCANGIHFLVRTGHDVCWNEDDYDATLVAYRSYWES